MPKISVIIPTYNRSTLIKDTIESVLKQTESDFEIIIVDDGSTDDTRKVVEDINDNRICYFYQNNSGVSAARNFGLSKCYSQYIAFLDSDDLWPKDYLSKMVSALEADNDFGAAYSPITLIYSNGKKIESYKRPEGKNGWITSDLFRNSFIWPSAIVLKSSACRGFFFDESLETSEDSDAFLRLSVKIKFVFVSEVEALHMISVNSLSKNAGVTFRRLLSMERFYFKLGGDKVIHGKIAKRRLSHASRKLAEYQRKQNARMSAIKLFKHAIKYWPYDMRLYCGLFRSVIQNKNNDSQPDWTMPESLSEPKAANRLN